MILKSKICGVSDSTTLQYIINHAYPSQFIGFIVNYPKSKRYVDLKKIKELLRISKKKSFYVAVLVNPDHKILEEIKNLPFDYYQLYDCSPDKVRFINMVKVGSQVRLNRTIISCEEMKNGGYRVVNKCELEIKDEIKPAFIAETISLVFP